MDGKRVLTVLAATLVGGTLLASSGAATPPDPGPGPTKPVAEQNMDADGFIRVHEQGVASVDVTNSNLDVTLSNEELDVNVKNFPSEQDVAVTNFPSEQAVRTTPITKIQEVIAVAEPGGAHFETMFEEISASSIVVTSIDHEFSLHVSSPLPSQFAWNQFMTNPQGDVGTHQFTFPHPFPIDGVRMFCVNESETCNIHVLITGF